MPDEQFKKPLRATELFAASFPPDPCYIEPNILTKGGTLLLGGQAKTGKSLLMLECIRATTTATPFLNNPDFTVPKQAVCLYIEAENGPRATKERGVKIFANQHGWENNFYVLSLKNPPMLDSVAGFNEYVSYIKDIKPNILVLDPISFMHYQEENDNRGIGRIYYILNTLKEINPEREMSVVMSHHFGKPPHNKQQAEGHDDLAEYNFRGASKWKDGADSIITMHRYKELPLDWEAWVLKMRFLCRHGSSPPEGRYIVNADNDLRIKYDAVTKAPKQPRSLKYDHAIAAEQAGHEDFIQAAIQTKIKFS